MKAGARLGAAVLAAAALVALSAPWLPLRDPAAQPDGLVLRNLPPLSRAYVLRLADGTERWANDVRPEADGDVAIRRGTTWSEIPRERLAGRAPAKRPLFVLGTDAFGRDLLSRLAWGARTSLVAGLLAACVAIGLGGTIGLASGLSGGRVDALLMRLTDGALAIPRLFLLVLVAALFRPSVTTLVLVIGGTTWMVASRLVRGEALAIKERDFVAAARASGAGRTRVALLHILPSAAPVLAVEGALRLGQSVLLEASLSFLGLGVPPPTPSWGNLIADGRDRLLDAWWIAAWPGLAIAAVVIAATLVAEGVGRKG
jgi:peptide/nickel transport system permease protein